MNERTNTDRLRAFLQGELSRDERESFERELARDAELRRRVEELRVVWSATAALGELAPVSATSWDALEQRAELDTRRRRVRRVAAALILFVPLAVLAYRAWPARASEPVVVRSSLLEAPAHAPQAPVPVPAVLADYAPVRDGSIQWLSSLDEARQVADAVGRPVLVFGFVPGCPWCKTLREESFVDPKFVELASSCVPVAVDLLSMEQERATELMERGYPAIELQAQHGELVRGMSGPPGTVDLRAELENGLKSWPSEPPPLVWNAANELTRELQAAQTAEREGRLDEAWRRFDEVARRAGAVALGLDGQLGIERIDELARTALQRTRELARTNEREAHAELATFAARLGATPPGDDLRRVLDAWTSADEFPALTSKPSE